MDIKELYELYKLFPTVETDTRKLKEGSIFFALKGDNFNGNNYALKALQLGAEYAIVDEEIEEKHPNIIRVENVLDTLQQLAKHHRKQFDIPFIAITGSNGKTTTKELINAVLSSHYKTYTTQGNLNNHIGIPLTILRIKSDAELAVIEMGANHSGEIKSYCSFTMPTHGIITNCGKAHLEGFGSEEGVRKAKGELYDYIREYNGSIFAFDDYDYLHTMSDGIKNIFWYGTKSGMITGLVSNIDNELLQVSVTSNPTCKIQTSLIGTYNLPNVLCAFSVGKLFLVPDEKIIAELERYTPDNSRSQLIKVGNNKIVLDAYNANPSSMSLAIENFAAIKNDKKVIILGAMMELGKESLQEHERVIKLLNNYSWDHVVLVGEEFNNIETNFVHFEDSDQAAQWIKSQRFEDTFFLVKGSRSMKMEKVIDSLSIK